jgi:hypothetical protein
LIYFNPGLFPAGNILLKKRSCIRFSVPGAILSYRKKPRFWRRNGFSEDRFPVVDLSRGGAKFLSDHRLKVGLEIDVRIHIPEVDETLEMSAMVRWVGRNPGTSYRFQTGIAFSPYGTRKRENAPEILDQLKQLESAYGIEEDET